MFLRWGNVNMKMEKKNLFDFSDRLEGKTHDVILIVRFLGFANVDFKIAFPYENIIFGLPVFFL